MTRSIFEARVLVWSGLVVGCGASLDGVGKLVLSTYLFPHHCHAPHLRSNWRESPSSVASILNTASHRTAIYQERRFSFTCCKDLPSPMPPFPWSSLTHPSPRLKSARHGIQVLASRQTVTHLLKGCFGHCSPPNWHPDSCMGLNPGCLSSFAVGFGCRDMDWGSMMTGQLDLQPFVAKSHKHARLFFCVTRGVRLMMDLQPEQGQVEAWRRNLAPRPSGVFGPFLTWGQSTSSPQRLGRS